MPEPPASLNEESPKPDPRELARKAVEDALDGPLEEEAGDPVGVPSAAGTPSAERPAAPATTTGAWPRRPARSPCACPSPKA